MALVPIARYREAQHDFEVEVNGHKYAFLHRKGMSMCGIEEEDVPKILSLSRVCCGGRRKKLFQHASPGQIDVWSTP